MVELYVNIFTEYAHMMRFKSKFVGTPSVGETHQKMQGIFQFLSHTRQKGTVIDVSSYCTYYLQLYLTWVLYPRKSLEVYLPSIILMCLMHIAHPPSNAYIDAI